MARIFEDDYGLETLRLSTSEIRLIFQLVKANADFPNLVYFLLFQRDIVERSLGSSPSSSGQEFLEKIVQVGFDIPRIEGTCLEKILFADLDKLLTDEKVSQRFDQKRWNNLFLGGLRPYFQTLRDVHRYLASLSFHVSLFRGTGSFEVNPVDLIALEVLRIFEPAVFRRLPEVKEDLTDIHELRKQVPGEAEIRKTLEGLLEQSSKSHRPHMQEILKQLFPTTEWIFGELHYGSEFADEWYRALRICHPDVFDRYFHLTIPEGDISQAQLDRILSLDGNHEGLVAEFRALNERGLLGVLLDRLEAYKQKIDISNAVTFVTALFDIGDELPEDPGGFFTISPEMHANRIIYWYLKQEEDIGKRGEILKKAMNATMGLYLPIIIASLDGNEEERKKDPDAFTVTDTDLEELHRICLKRIEQAVGSGALASHPKMLYILYRWREWKSPDSSRQWVEKLIASGDGVLSFLTACLHRSTSHGMGDHVSQEHWRIKMKTVEDFVSVDILEEKVAALSCENLSDDQKKAVKAFQKAIKRRQEERSDDDWRNDDDE